MVKFSEQKHFMTVLQSYSNPPQRKRSTPCLKSSAQTTLNFLTLSMLMRRVRNFLVFLYQALAGLRMKISVSCSMHWLVSTFIYILDSSLIIEAQIYKYIASRYISTNSNLVTITTPTTKRKNCSWKKNQKKKRVYSFIDLKYKEACFTEAMFPVSFGNYDGRVNGVCFRHVFSRSS